MAELEPNRDARVLVVDDDRPFADDVAEMLSNLSWEASSAGCAKSALDALRSRDFDAVVTDLRMPEVDGLGLLTQAKQLAPERPVIMMTAVNAIDSAIECVRRGAYHYLTKPFKVDELDLVLQRALQASRLRRTALEAPRALQGRYSLGALLGRSTAMGDVFDLVRRVADAALPVVILGETGVGKSLLAHSLHVEGSRAKAPFVSVNCAALPEPLLESELFGHARGAFTGALSARTGLFEQAHGGTLFLDEIGDMQPCLQAKLLHVLESGVVRPIGSSRERAVDVRIVSATHRDLRKLVAAAAFREDLLYRLDGVAIEVPPLRQRREDIPLLAQRILERARERQPGTCVERFSSAATQVLLDCHWPGNVRQLEHAINRSVLLARGEEIQPEDLPASIHAVDARATRDFGDVVIPVRALQRRYAAWALKRLDGRKMLTCKKLDIDSKTLAKWLSTDEE